MTVLAMPPEEEGECLHARQGGDGRGRGGCNVHVVDSILCGRANNELNMIKKNVSLNFFLKI
jgi:hypothetical protein